MLGTAGPPPVICRGPASGLADAWIDGCADYLKEPWTPRELHFRVNRFLSVLDRGGTWRGLRITAEGLSYGGPAVWLSEQERKILLMLVRHAGAPVPREALFYGLWGKPGGISRVVDVHVSKLRKKLAAVQGAVKPAGRIRIVSVHGEGYTVTGPAEPAP